MVIFTYFLWRNSWYSSITILRFILFSLFTNIESSYIILHLFHVCKFDFAKLIIMLWNMIVNIVAQFYLRKIRIIFLWHKNNNYTHRKVLELDIVYVKIKFLFDENFAKTSRHSCIKLKYKRRPERNEIQIFIRHYLQIFLP